MSKRTEWILISVILASILGLFGTGLGIAVIAGASTSEGNQALAVSATPVTGVTHVFIRNYTYQPANIEVVWGTTVSWTNEDTAIHSVVLPHIITSETDIRESGPLSQGQSFNYTFLARGTFQYSCAEHPYMVGIVTVM